MIKYFIEYLIILPRSWLGNISVGDDCVIEYDKFDLEESEGPAFMPSHLLTKKQLKEVNDFGGQVLIEEVYNTFGIKKGAQGKSRGQLDRNKNRWYNFSIALDYELSEHWLCHFPRVVRW